MKRLGYVLPALIFFALTGIFFYQLRFGEDPRAIPSVLIDKPVPELALAPLPGQDRGLTTADLKGKVSLVNIFGSWCVACLAEHPVLNRIKESGVVPVYGIDWNEKDPMDAVRWLARNGDPYTLVGVDVGSRAAIDFGVTGAPETFVVDKQGHIRYKHVGPITPDDWENTLLPMIRELSK